MFRSTFFISVLIAGLLATPIARAQIVSSFVREQVGALPQGRFMISLVNVNAGIGRNFNQQGDLTLLSDQVNRPITFQKIATDEPTRGNQLQGLFASNEVKLSDSAGELRGSLTGQVSGKVPVVGYGINDRLGIYLSVPIIEFQLRTSYSFVQSDQTQKFLASLENNGQKTVADSFQVALNTSLENKLATSDYRYEPNVNKTLIGDLQVMLMALHREVKADDWSSATQFIAILPTATDLDLQDLYALHVSDQRFGLGVKHAVQIPLRLPTPGLFQFNASGGVQYLFAAQQSRRIPIATDDELYESIDPAAEVSQGAKTSLQAQLRYTFPRWVGLTTGLSWQRKFDDRIEGSRYDPSFYEIASRRTGYELYTYYAGLDLNSIPSFLEGKFLIPAIAELGVGVPLKGKNAIAEPVVQLQGTVFF